MHTVVFFCSASRLLSLLALILLLPGTKTLTYILYLTAAAAPACICDLHWSVDGFNLFCFLSLSLSG